MAFSYPVAQKVIGLQMAELLNAFGPPGNYGTAVALYYPSLPQDQSCFYEGMANDTTPVSQDTIFAIGSLTKTFTPTMFTLLNIPADMSIKNFLPSSVQSNANIATITFGELATHTSGMPRVASDKIDNDAADALFQDQPAPDDLLSYWQTYSGHDPGTCWTYSNIGFLTLGYALVGAAAQERYTTLLNVITNPTTGLNMPSTVVDVSRFPTDLVALGHFNGQPREIKNAPDLKSSAADMWTWMMANLTAPDNPSPLDNALVAATSFHQVKLPNCDCKTKWGSAMGYAWEIADDGMVWKDGATSQGGCSGWVGMMLSPTDPELRLGVAILVNGYNKDAQTHTELVPDSYGRTILNQIYTLITA